MEEKRPYNITEVFEYDDLYLFSNRTFQYEKVDRILEIKPIRLTRYGIKGVSKEGLSLFTQFSRESLQRAKEKFPIVRKYMEREKIINQNVPL
jgi:hypothetical protein